jgi:hypothetical protein
MKFINSILSFTGLTALIAAAVLFVLNRESIAMILFAISLFSFTVMLFFYLYRMYLLINLKKNDQPDQP